MQMRRLIACVLAAAGLMIGAARADNAAIPKEGDWIAHDFRFHTGEVMPSLRLHYTTLGDPTGQPVLVLHGTAGTGAGMLGPNFGGVLFGPGQPLDAAKYYIILPDILGAGQSSKPSDGLRAAFPQYDYDDMVRAEYLLVTEGLGLHHLRLVLGNSMGGMQTWMWGIAYPDFMDALVPMASQPTEMAGRNWMMRRLLVEAIRRDPEYQGGNYTTEPTMLRVLNVLFGVATNGGTLGLQSAGATHAMADRFVDAQLDAPAPGDANDFLYQWNASRDYNPAAGLARIAAAVLAINSADDERNPPQTGLMDQAMARLRHGQLYLIPASAETHGHGTTGFARFWAPQLAAFLQSLPANTGTAAANQ